MLPVKVNTLSPSRFNRDEFLTPFSTLFDNFFNDSFDFLGKDFFEKGTYPKVDIRNEENKIIIDAEVPGLTKNQLNLEVDGDILRIKGDKKEVDGSKSNTYVHRELKHSSFCRSFNLGDNVDVSKIDAKFENGVLEITIPKKVVDPKIPPIKKIEIQ
jgi:HSP20 family protein